MSENVPTIDDILGPNVDSAISNNIIKLNGKYSKNIDKLLGGGNISIDNILNNDCFFSDSKEENEWFDDTNDNLMSQHIDYFENYNLKQLHHISNYYNIPKRRLKKDELIELIVQFENSNDNLLIVYNRKRFWHYLQELKTDSYFGKFIDFD